MEEITYTVKKNVSDDFRGEAKVIELSEPVEVESYEGITQARHFVVSKVRSLAIETYAFVSDEDGRVLDWGEVTGESNNVSQRGFVSIETVAEELVEEANNGQLTH